ncbi:hypothetical protein KSP40_PGU015766 [Platanthera guangdongensis]|uniref:Uncharacterized protein n=1 Tax=Platanthera guangdongensis TaxID=2320717 RepID=A0ABR2M9F7_9ASPA
MRESNTEEDAKSNGSLNPNYFHFEINFNGLEPNKPVQPATSEASKLAAMQHKAPDRSISFLVLAQQASTSSSGS